MSEHMLTPEELVAALAADPQAALDALPPEEREAFERAQQSIVDARRRAEAGAHWTVIW